MSLLQEIADEAGVSAVTVSRILGGSYRTSRPSAVARAERIRAIAGRLGWRPNGAARAIATGRFATLGLVIPRQTYASTVFTPLLRGIEGAATAAGQRLLLSTVPGEDLAAGETLPPVLRELCCDGLLIDYGGPLSPQVAAAVAAQPVPTLWLNARHDRNSVHPDDVAGGRIAAEHLLGLGHRRLAFASFTPSQHYSVRDRLSGARAASAGLPVASWELPPGGEPGRVDRLALARDWLQRPDRPTAVIAYCGATALPILLAASQLGLRVPQDLAIVIFAETGVPTLDGRSFSRVDIPFEETGRRAVELLLERIGGAEPAGPLAIAPRLLVRDTCGGAA